MAALTFAEFAALNRQRCEAPDGFDRRLDTTTVTHWALGVCEEAGEVAGVVYAMDHRPQKGKTTQDLADEIADVVSYCDLLAQRIGRSLEDVLRNKWNRVSERIGSPLRIAGAPAPCSHCKLKDKVFTNAKGDLCGLCDGTYEHEHRGPQSGACTCGQRLSDGVRAWR